MEKRFFLATFLSLIVLFAWTIIAPRPKQAYVPKITQHIENKIVVDEKQNQPLPSSLQHAAALIEPEIKTIETEKLVTEFSNIGGVLWKVTLKEYGVALPARGMGGAPEYDHLEFAVEKIHGNEIVYKYATPEITIRRSYRVSSNDYTIETQTTVQNRTEMSKLISWQNQGLQLDMSNLKEFNEDQDRDRSLYEYVISTATGIERKNNAFKFASNEQKNISATVSWIGFRNRYFCAITKPLYETGGYELNILDSNKLQINIKSKEITIDPQKSTVFSSLIFVGPEKSDLLAGYKSGFEDIKRYYRFTLFDAIAKIIYSLLNVTYKIVPNWGVAVILISIFVYGAMYPLTLRSMMSMRKMQALQPKIAGLREKYKDNPQKMNLEMMELYKKNQVNPFGGCLPMLLQTPVFIGLYQVLWRSVSFKGANFLWIKDLSEPDRLAILPFSLPFLGNEVNLLPIVMAIVMVFQQKLTSKSMGVVDPAVVAQQKMMAVIMPIFIGAIFYRFASGLTLYFTLFYAFSTLNQWKISKLPAAI